MTKVVKKTNKLYISLSLLILVITIYFTFSSVLNHSFLSWDDPVYVTENPLIKVLSWQNTKKLFSSFVSGNYHPLTLLSYSLEYHFFETNSYYYHLNNLLLHITNALLVFFLILKFGNNIFIAFITALLFAIHPLRVESVAWVADRKDLLYGFFIISSMIFYWNYIQKEKLNFYILTIVFFIFSLLAKSMALAYPFILILFDYYSERKITSKVIQEKIPFFIIALLFGVIALYARESYLDILHENTFTFTESFFLGTYRLVYYFFFRILFPGNVAWLYPYPNIEYPSVLLISSSIIIIISLLFIVLFSFKKTKNILFGLCFFFLTIAPALTVPILGHTADRFSYIPSIGILYLISVFFFHLLNKMFLTKKILKSLTMFFLLSIIISFSFTSWQNNKLWKDDITFWEYSVKSYPNIYLPYFHRGNAYYVQGKYILAASDYSQVLQLYPKYAEAYNNLGLSYNALGKSVDACRNLNMACNLGYCNGLDWAQENNICP